MKAVSFEFQVNGGRFIFVEEDKELDSIIAFLQRSGQSWTRESLFKVLEAGGKIVITAASDLAIEDPIEWLRRNPRAATHEPINGGE